MRCRARDNAAAIRWITRLIEMLLQIPRRTYFCLDHYNLVLKLELTEDEKLDLVVEISDEDTLAK
jgi:hypothetical protein